MMALSRKWQECRSVARVWISKAVGVLASAEDGREFFPARMQTMVWDDGVDDGVGQRCERRCGTTVWDDGMGGWRSASMDDGLASEVAKALFGAFMLVA